MLSGFWGSSREVKQHWILKALDACALHDILRKFFERHQYNNSRPWIAWNSGESFDKWLGVSVFDEQERTVPALNPKGVTRSREIRKLLLGPGTDL